MNPKLIITLILIVSLYYPINLKYINTESGRLAIWSLFLLVLMVGFEKKNFSDKRTRISFIVLLCLQIIYINTISIFNDSFELTFLLFYIEKLIMLPVVVCFLVSWNKLTLDKICSLFSIVLFLQAAAMLLNIAAPVTKELFSLFVESGVPKSFYSFRHIGLTGFVSYSNGFLLFLSLPIYLISGKKTHLYLAIVCFILAIVFSRTSIVIYAIFLLILSIQLLKKPKIKVRNFNFILIASVSILIIIYFISISVPEHLLNWFFDLFFTLASGKLPDGFLVLRDQIWLPDINTLIFGDSKLTGTTGRYYMNTDVGYMRYILYFGIIGLFIHILIISVFFLNKMSFIEKPMRSAFIAYIFSIIIVTYKGNFIMDTWGLLVGFLFFSEKIMNRGNS